MADIGNRDGRTRAWILIQADSPRATAQRLYDNLCNEGGDSYVVIRADVVDYVYNMVIPVDAASEEWLQRVHAMIREITGVRHTAILSVVQSIPSVPHDAHGYITPGEIAGGHDKTLQPGRQHWSPGANAWG